MEAYQPKSENTFEPAPPFEYPKTEIVYRNHLAGRGASSQRELRHLEIPSIGENGQDRNLDTALYFGSTLPGSHPLPIVLRIWGGYTYPSRKVSSYLQRHSEVAIHLLDLQGRD